MFRSSEQRNSRCQDFKVKRALQICVLLGVCIWMVYLVQHSHQKKTSYGEGTKADSEVVKFGRKDPHPNVEQSSIKYTRDEEDEEEEENKHEKKNKIDNVNGVEDENLMQKNKQNINEKKLDHRQDPVDQDNEESSMTNKISEENDHKANKESDNIKEDNEDNKYMVEEDNQSREINEKKSETTREKETENDEAEEINQKKIEVKEDEEENHKQEEKEESNATQNERKGNDDKERNSEEPKEKHYKGENASNVVGLNKTKQSDQRENNDIVWNFETNGNQVAHLDQKERVLSVTEPKTTHKSSIVESDKQQHNKPPSDDVKTLHSQNGTNKTSNTVEEQFETSENSKGMNNTTLRLKESNSDVVVEQADSTVTNSSEANESNVTKGEYDGKKNANENGNDGPVGAFDSSILDETDGSSMNNNHPRLVKNENIDTSESEDEVQNEPVKP